MNGLDILYILQTCPSISALLCMPVLAPIVHEAKNTVIPQIYEFYMDFSFVIKITCGFAYVSLWWWVCEGLCAFPPC